MRGLIDGLLAYTTAREAQVAPIPVDLAELVRDIADSLGGMVTVHIADNGIGIPPGQHDAIFGNFHRAHAGGSYAGAGLGLAICKRIVERHGGGSCFSFSLPADSTVLSPV